MPQFSASQNISLQQIFIECSIRVNVHWVSMAKIDNFAYTSVNQSRPALARNHPKMYLLRLYKAALTLQINGPCQRLLLKRRVPAALYEFFSIPKHLSIKDLRDLKDLKTIHLIKNKGQIIVKDSTCTFNYYLYEKPAKSTCGSPHSIGRHHFWA